MSEGAPFTGLKPAGTPVELPIAEADKALESGSADKLVKLVNDDATMGIRKRFADALEKKTHAQYNVEAGREFVTACVAYVHYLEGLHLAAQGASHHHEDGPAPEKDEHKSLATQHQH